MTDLLERPTAETEEGTIQVWLVPNPETGKLEQHCVTFFTRSLSGLKTANALVFKLNNSNLNYDLKKEDVRFSFERKNCISNQVIRSRCHCL